MPRKITLEAPKLEPPKPETWTLTLKTITPMFGGSAAVREVDAAYPVRAASVRGHLRFWWRATAGARYADPKELFKAEEEIWGSAERYGKVAIKVTEQSAESKLYADFVSGFGDPRGYALFPFAKQGDQEVARCLEKVKFSLTLTCPTPVRSEVEMALQAWVAFGGIGARTRRGCGSLEFVNTRSFSHQIQVFPRSKSSFLTHLPGRYLVGEKAQSADAAWKRVLELYKFFRQGKDFARNPGSDPSKPNKLGRSRYPEPDSIRRLSGRNSRKHPPNHLVTGYPRADLGLPIVFHFKSDGDPPDHTLESASNFGTRFASPVITKAVKVEGGYAPAIILLDAPHVWEAGDLKFGKQEKTVTRAEVELSSEQLKQIEPLNGQPIREALLEFAKSKGFKEVQL